MFSEIYAAQRMPFEKRCALVKTFFEAAQKKIQPMLDEHLRYVDKAKKIAEDRASMIPGATEALQKMFATRKSTLNEGMEKSYAAVWELAIDSARMLYGSDAVDTVLKDFSKKGKAN